MAKSNWENDQAGILILIQPFFRASARLLKKYSYSSEQSGLYILCHNVFWMPDKLLPSVRKKCENMGLGSGLYVLVVTWSHGGWICGLVRKASLWAFCSRRGGWADEWRVRFQHHETLNGLVMVPVQCSSFPTGRLSYPPGIPSWALETAAVDVRKSGEKLHIHTAAVGRNGGQIRQRQEIWWLIICSAPMCLPW